MSDVKLLGADGKELDQPKPQERSMVMDRQQKFNMVFMVFTIMTREERQKLMKMLKPLRHKLDFMYPNGMTEEDVKRDIEKAAAEIVPQEQGHPVSPVAEVQPEHGVPVQPDGDAQSTEGTPQ